MSSSLCLAPIDPYLTISLSKDDSRFESFNFEGHEYQILGFLNEGQQTPIKSSALPINFLDNHVSKWDAKHPYVVGLHDRTVCLHRSKNTTTATPPHLLVRGETRDDPPVREKTPMKYWVGVALVIAGLLVVAYLARFSNCIPMSRAGANAFVVVTTLTAVFSLSAALPIKERESLIPPNVLP